jgi:hypothetical protein
MGGYRSRSEVAAEAATAGGVHAAREAAGRGGWRLVRAGGWWHAAPTCKKQWAEAANGSGGLEGGGSARGWRPRGTGVREAVGSSGRWLGRAGGQRQHGPTAVATAAREGGLHVASGKRRPMARARSGLLCVVRTTDKECDFG